MATPNFGASTAFQGVPSQNYNVVCAGFDKIFSEGFAAAKPQADFVQKRTATGKTVNLVAALQAAPVKIWRDDKYAKRYNNFFVNIPMLPLESTLTIDKYDFMGDVIGAFGDQVKHLGGQAAMFTDRQWAIAVQSGLASDYASFWQGVGGDDWGLNGNVTGDGLPLFHSAHTFANSNTAAQSNMVTGSFSDPTTWANAYDLMQGYIGDQGNPLYVEPKAIVYAPSDQFNILNAIDAKFTAPGLGAGGSTSKVTTNVVALDNVINRWGLELKKLNYLNNNPGVAYLIGEVNGVVSSYEYMLEPLHLVPNIDPTSQRVFNNHEFTWSIEGFGRVIVPQFFTIIRVADPALAKNVT